MIAVKNNFCIRRAKEMRWMLILNNWTRFLRYLGWPEQLWKRRLKPTPKQANALFCFRFALGVLKGTRGTGTEVPEEGKVSPTESSGLLVLSVQNLACRELWLNYFHEPQKNQFSFSLTPRWLRWDDYTTPPTQQMTLAAPLGEEIILWTQSSATPIPGCACFWLLTLPPSSWVPIIMSNITA